MWGISYGGFTAIQVAALRPPHLRAIVPVMATDDRYLDDVHYRGGCVTVSELSQYAVSQVAMNAMPPDAAFRGAPWRDEWLARLDATPPWLFAWLRQQTDGPYWRQGSLAPDYDAIEAAIFNIGGWQDSYVDPAFRMQARCPAPSHTLVGNWVHSWPHDAAPGPNLDELHEIARFFDRHLRGADNGWDTEPPIVWFEREYAPPAPFPVTIAGPLARGDGLPAPGDGRPAPVLRGGSGPAGRAARRAGRGRRRVASTPSRIGRPRAPAAPCRGAPATLRTASRATSGGTRTPARPTRPTPWTGRSRSSASRKSWSTSRSTPLSRPYRCGCRTWRRTGAWPWSAPAC